MLKGKNAYRQYMDGLFYEAYSYRDFHTHIMLKIDMKRFRKIPGQTGNVVPYFQIKILTTNSGFT